MTIPMYSRSSDIKTFVTGEDCEGGWLLKHLYANELPDTTWFILGTAVHSTIEDSIENDWTLDEMLGDVDLNLMMAVGEATNGILESTAKNAKRSKATMRDDAQRLTTRWYNAAHPEGNVRNPIFDLYDWPPKVEHRIVVKPRDMGRQLYTTVDAIFEGGPDGEAVMIVDWKTGSTTSAPHSQLQTYFFGGLEEGWIEEDANKLLVGRFFHVDHFKDEPVFDYYGDTVIDTWIKRTHDTKMAMLDHGPAFSPDWYCKYCPARQACPLRGDGSFKDIGNRLDSIRLTYIPTDRKEDK